MMCAPHFTWCASGHGGWLTDGVISASGAQAVTSSGDELAVVWDTHQGSCLNVLEGHSGEVRSVVLTRRGRWVAALRANVLCTLYNCYNLQPEGFHLLHRDWAQSLSR